MEPWLSTGRKHWMKFLNGVQSFASCSPATYSRAVLFVSVPRSKRSFKKQLPTFVCSVLVDRPDTYACWYKLCPLPRRFVGTCRWISHSLRYCLDIICQTNLNDSFKKQDASSYWRPEAIKLMLIDVPWRPLNDAINLFHCRFNKHVRRRERENNIYLLGTN